MIWLSLAAIFLMATIHLPNGHTPHVPISIELQERNPIAWLFMAALGGVICVFARRLKRSGHIVRTVLFLLDLVGLIVIAGTPPNSRIHENTLGFIVVLTVLWFIVMAIDYGRQDILIASVITPVVLLIIAFLSIGLAEKALVLYSLVSSNLLYYGGHLDEDGGMRRLWN